MNTATRVRLLSIEIEELARDMTAESVSYKDIGIFLTHTASAMKKLSEHMGNRNESKG